MCRHTLRLLTVPLLVCALAPAAHAQRPAPPAQDPLARLNESVDALTRKVWPSVVQIMVTSYGAREESARGAADVVVGRQRSVGSGFVIDGEGYIMTNAHVVNGAQRIQVVLPPTGADGSLATALTSRMSVISARIVLRSPVARHHQLDDARPDFLGQRVDRLVHPLERIRGGERTLLRGAGHRQGKHENCRNPSGHG